GALVLGVPNRFMRDWVDDHYNPLIVELLARMEGEVTRVTYEVVAVTTPAPSVEVAPTVKSQVLTRPGRLNARFTFSTFVVADSNQLPAAAARAVADKPGKHYNPLFIYGGSGLGKTHLLHAVGNAIHQ